MDVGSKGKEGMKEDPGFCLAHWMDDGPIDQGGNPVKRAGLEEDVLFDLTKFEVSRGQANGAIQSTDGCKVVKV